VGILVGVALLFEIDVNWNDRILCFNEVFRHHISCYRPLWVMPVSRSNLRKSKALHAIGHFLNRRARRLGISGLVPWLGRNNTLTASKIARSGRFNSSVLLYILPYHVFGADVNRITVGVVDLMDVHRGASIRLYLRFVDSAREEASATELYSEQHVEVKVLIRLRRLPSRMRVFRILRALFFGRPGFSAFIDAFELIGLGLSKSPFIFNRLSSMSYVDAHDFTRIAICLLDSPRPRAWAELSAGDLRENCRVDLFFVEAPFGGTRSHFL